VRRNQSSLTAIGIAVNRAFESSKPAGERICYDPLARHFVDPVLYRLFTFFIISGYAERRGPGVQAFLAARERYIDDYLQACIDDGLEQLVILGAGFDSRPYRFQGLQGRVKVFEVDYSTTQQAKITKLKAIFGSVPDYVVYVPIDFNTQLLDERLLASGYDRQLKTLFIWQGVTEYLTPEAVDRTLAFVVQKSGDGSSVIFDYIYASALRARHKHGEVASMQRYRGLTGEGLTFGIEKGDVEEFLKRRGFCGVKNVMAADLKGLYFTGINHRRQIASNYAIASATVMPRTVRGTDYQAHVPIIALSV
jgi:methyltransferase (TIGR00027 family)